MITSEIFDKIYQYLNREISLGDLEDWVAARFGLFVTLPQGDARDLYGTIELGLAEMSIGHRTEEEFRALVREFIKSHDFRFVSLSEYQATDTGCTPGLQIGEWNSTVLPLEQWTPIPYGAPEAVETR